MGARPWIGLLLFALALSGLIPFLRRRVRASKTANPGRTILVEEIRQRFDVALAGYHGEDREAVQNAFESGVVLLRAKYGDQVPSLEALRFLRSLPLPQSTPDPKMPPPQAAEDPADGLTVEWTAMGFLLRAAPRDLVSFALWLAFAGLMVLLPFRIWDDLLRDAWEAGLHFSGAGLFLGLWGLGALCFVAMGVMALAGEIRIAKAGDQGEIFKGIGCLGRTHRFRWSDFDTAGLREVAVPSSKGRYEHVDHEVSLSGRAGRYDFGRNLSYRQQEFVAAFLGKHGFR